MHLQPAVTVPESIVVAPDDAGLIEAYIRHFFDAIMTALRLGPAYRRAFVTVEPRELRYGQPAGGHATNDRLTLLLINDFPAASVLETRTPLNYVCLQAAVYTLSEPVSAHILQTQSI